MQFLELLQYKTDLVFCLLISGIALIVGYMIGRNRKAKTLQSALRHTENHRNELHVQCITLREMIDNQELDIQRYVQELQLCMEREKNLISEKTNMELAASQRLAEAYAPKSIPVPAQVAIILQEELHQVQREKEVLAAKLASTEEVMRFLMAKETEQVS